MRSCFEAGEGGCFTGEGGLEGVVLIEGFKDGDDVRGSGVGVGGGAGGFVEGPAGVRGDGAVFEYLGVGEDPLGQSLECFGKWKSSFEAGRWTGRSSGMGPGFPFDSESDLASALTPPSRGIGMSSSTERPMHVGTQTGPTGGANPT